MGSSGDKTSRFTFPRTLLFFFIVFASMLATVLVISSLNSTVPAVKEVFNSVPMGVFTTIVIGIIVIIAVIEYVAPLFDKGATFVTAFVTTCLLLSLVFSSDGMSLLPRLFDVNVPELALWIGDCISYAFFLLMLSQFFRFFTRDYGLKASKTETWVSLVILILDAVSFPLSSYFGFALASYVPMVMLITYWLIKFTRSHLEQTTLQPTFVFSMLISLAALAAELGKSLRLTNGINFDCVGVTPIFYSFIVSAFFFIYLFFAFRTTQEADTAQQRQKKIDELTSSVLRNQQDPHFIFNSLFAIKGLYATNKEEGDRAMDLFAKHLRAYTDLGPKALISLMQELQIIQEFVELENMKKVKPYNVIFNIDIDDFDVPPFSLQTLVENAMRYGRTNEKKDSYIEIATSQDQTHNIVEIIDNGVGFDVNSIGENSHGIQTSKERFELLLNASFHLDSVPGIGTTITIRIPKSGEPKAE